MCGEQFKVQQMLATRERWKMATEILAKAAVKWLREGRGIPKDLEDKRTQQMCNFMCVDNFLNVSHLKENVEHVLRHLIETNKWDLAPKPASPFEEKLKIKDFWKDILIFKVKTFRGK